MASDETAADASAEPVETECGRGTPTSVASTGGPVLQTRCQTRSNGSEVPGLSTHCWLGVPLSTGDGERRVSSAMAARSVVVKPPDANTLRVLLATDCHLGRCLQMKECFPRVTLCCVRHGWRSVGVWSKTGVCLHVCMCAFGGIHADGVVVLCSLQAMRSVTPSVGMTGNYSLLGYRVPLGLFIFLYSLPLPSPPHLPGLPPPHKKSCHF